MNHLGLIQKHDARQLYKHTLQPMSESQEEHLDLRFDHLWREISICGTMADSAEFKRRLDLEEIRFIAFKKFHGLDHYKRNL